MRKQTGIDRCKKRQLHTLDKYVIFSIAALLIYTVVEMIVSTLTGVSHDVLTERFFLCIGGEVLSCALIKIFKLRRENDERDNL